MAERDPMNRSKTSVLPLTSSPNAHRLAVGLPPRSIAPRQSPGSDLERFDKDARELGALAQSSRTFAAASFASRTASRTAA